MRWAEGTLRQARSALQRGLARARLGSPDEPAGPSGSRSNGTMAFRRCARLKPSKRRTRARTLSPIAGMEQTRLGRSRIWLLFDEGGTPRIGTTSERRATRIFYD